MSLQVLPSAAGDLPHAHNPQTPPNTPAAQIPGEMSQKLYLYDPYRYYILLPGEISLDFLLRNPYHDLRLSLYPTGDVNNCAFLHTH
jgi:hypothetical protein